MRFPGQPGSVAFGYAFQVNVHPSCYDMHTQDRVQLTGSRYSLGEFFCQGLAIKAEEAPRVMLSLMCTTEEGFC